MSKRRSGLCRTDRPSKPISAIARAQMRAKRIWNREERRSAALRRALGHREPDEGTDAPDDSLGRERMSSSRVSTFHPKMLDFRLP